MKKVVVLGAGRSSTTLIQYLLDNSVKYNWKITVADQDLELAKSKIGNQERGEAILFNVHDELLLKQTILDHDVIVSLLPPHLHDLVAKDCVAMRKHLVTASYISKAVSELNDEAKKAGVLLMCEMGLDPGIDHLSAMKTIHEIRNEGGEITTFKSYCGGLVAPESDDNPWHYKFTWNPRNVVVAGQGTAQYLENGKNKFIPYTHLFSRIEKIKVGNLGRFEAYANRDSLSYIEKYSLQDVPNVLRATLRGEGYCKAWNILVQLGVTDDSFAIHNSESLTYAQWIESFLPQAKNKKDSLRKRLTDYLSLKKKDELLDKLEWLGIFQDKRIGLANATPAQIMQQLLENKWKMKKQDKDMVVMHHLFEYKKGKKKFVHTSTMAIKGTDSIHTAIAKTVGLPLGIMVKLLLTTDLKLSGVHIPVMPEVYVPALNELEELGIAFNEEVKKIK